MGPDVLVLKSVVMEVSILQLFPDCFTTLIVKLLVSIQHYNTYQWSPTFLAPETTFVQDNFPRDQGGGWGEIVSG